MRSGGYHRKVQNSCGVKLQDTRLTKEEKRNIRESVRRLGPQGNSLDWKTIIDMESKRRLI